MGGRTVRFRNWEVQYFPEGRGISSDEPIGNFTESDDRLLAHHPRLRRILVRVVPRQPLGCFYLHWSDGSDLTALDERVSSGTARDADFAGAVVGEATGISHEACGSPLRVVDLNQVIPLFSDPVERSSAHKYQQLCPVCGKQINASILEFIEPGS